MRKLLERYSVCWTSDSIRLFNTPGKIAKSLGVHLQEVGYFKTYPSYFVERENLDSFLIVYTLNGEGTLCYKDCVYSLERGECFFINCMDRHYYQIKGDKWEFLWVHFNGREAPSYFELFSKDEFKTVSVKRRELFERELWRLIEIHQNKSVVTDILTSQCIRNLLTELIVQKTSGNVGDFSVPKYIKEMMRYIDLHFSEEMKLTELAEMQHFNKFYLSHMFSKYTGFTVKEYIIFARISHAKKLLKYTDKSVREIAEECGVNNVSHFINLFKDREGTTPYRYRNDWK